MHFMHAIASATLLPGIAAACVRHAGCSPEFRRPCPLPLRDVLNSFSVGFLMWCQIGDPYVGTSIRGCEFERPVDSCSMVSDKSYLDLI